MSVHSGELVFIAQICSAWPYGESHCAMDDESPATLEPDSIVIFLFSLPHGWDVCMTRFGMCFLFTVVDHKYAE